MRCVGLINKLLKCSNGPLHRADVRITLHYIQQTAVCVCVLARYEGARVRRNEKLAH